MSVWFLLCVVWGAVICAADNDMTDIVPNVIITRYATPLHKAAQQGDFRMISWLLTNCLDHYPIDQLNNEGKTPLQLASECACTVYCKHDKVAYLLLSAGANPNPASEHLCDGSPLHVAVRKEWRSVVELLLEKGADPFALDVNKETPYDVPTTGKIKQILLMHSLNDKHRSDKFNLYDYRLRLKQLLKLADGLLALQDS